MYKFEKNLIHRRKQRQTTDQTKSRRKFTNLQVLLRLYKQNTRHLFVLFKRCGNEGH